MNNFSRDVCLLQDQLGPEVLALIWVTQEKFSRDLRLFKPLDDFLDGLLSNNKLYTLEMPFPGLSKNIFFSDHYGDHFVVGHFIADHKLESDLEEFMSVVAHISPKKQVIRVAHPKNKPGVEEVKKVLCKKYKNFEFLPLEL